MANNPVAPTNIKYNATIRFNKRGMSKIAIPATNETIGINAICSVMIKILLDCC